MACGYSLSSIVMELAVRAGMDPRMVNVSRLERNVPGFAITNAYACIEAMRALSQVFIFDPANYDGRVHFVPRGANAVATITDDDFLDDEQEVEQDKRGDPIQIPRVLNLNYFDVLGALAPDKQTSERSGDRRATGEMQLQTAVVLNADEAAQAVAIQHKVMIEDMKGELKFSLSDKFLKLVPSNCVFIQWDGRTERVRLTKVETFDGYQQYLALRDRQSAYTSNIEGFPAAPTSLPANQSVGPTLMEPLDIHILHDVDDALGFSMYVAITGITDAWQGAEVEISYDGGQNYVDSESVTTPTFMGELMTTLSDHPTEFPDVTNVCQVRIDTLDADLDQSDLAGMLNRQNFAIVGDEIIQFANATETTDDGVWEISYFLRGRKGTTTASHPPGTRFVMLGNLVAIPMSVTDLNREITLRATSVGAAVETGTVKTFTYTGRCQIERAVAYLEARVEGSDAIVTWQGVGRLGGGAQVAHGARFAGYRVTFSDGSNPDIVVNTDNQEVTQNVSSLSGPITISVVQMNDLTGAGPSTEVVL